MARPTLYTHPKFRRLCYELRMPEPHVLGHLEFMWRVAYESGQATMGDAVDVELAAQWHGEPGVFAAALVKVRLLDEADDGTLVVHDLDHHAPEYVSGRMASEAERRRDKVCLGCGGTYHSPDPRADYCAAKCRQRAYRTRHGDGSVTDPPEGGHQKSNTVRVGDGLVTDRSVTVTDRYGAPAPAPAPAPIHTERGDTATPAASPRHKFIPPRLDEIRAEVTARGISVDPEAFFAHYEANGWVQGRGKPVKNWRACLITWAKNEPKFAGPAPRNGNGSRHPIVGTRQANPETVDLAAIEEARRLYDERMGTV